jgi:hypothetical protein
MPVPATDTWWELRGGRPTEPVANSVVSAIRCYALPAIQAGLDDLDHQIDPDVDWPRTFMQVPDIHEQPDGGGAARDAWYLQPAGTEADESFAELASDITRDRQDAADYVAEHALSDPRAVPALVDRLERDPSPVIRKEVASRMLTLRARAQVVRSALQASAAEDEDPMVRWAARYALRLDLDRDPGREALARWPLDGGSAVAKARVTTGATCVSVAMAGCGPGEAWSASRYTCRSSAASASIAATGGTAATAYRVQCSAAGSTFSTLAVTDAAALRRAEDWQAWAYLAIGFADGGARQGAASGALGVAG